MRLLPLCLLFPACAWAAPTEPPAQPAPSEGYAIEAPALKAPVRLSEKELGELRARSAEASAKLSQTLRKLMELEAVATAKPDSALSVARKEADEQARLATGLFRRLAEQESLPPAPAKGETKEPSPLPVPKVSKRTEEQAAGRVVFVRNQLAVIKLEDTALLRPGAELVLSRDLVQLSRGTVLTVEEGRVLLLTSGFAASAKPVGEVMLAVAQ